MTKILMTKSNKHEYDGAAYVDDVTDDDDE